MEFNKEWRLIKGTEHYYVSEDGQVYNAKHEKYLTASASKNGYLRVNIQGKVQYIHRLVCIAFWGKPDDKVVDHINRITSDNHYKNLRWVTPAVNNTNRKIKKQLYQVKFTFNQWRKIINRYLTGKYSQHEIAEWGNNKFKRNSHVMIYNSIVNGKTFKKYYTELSTKELNKINRTIEKYKTKK